MGYSSDDSMVRVDFFKSSGKWYASEAIKIEGYNMPSPHGALMKAINRQLYNLDAGRLRYSGMTAVCLEMYHKHAFPLMLKLPETGLFILSEFDALEK